MATFGGGADFNEGAVQGGVTSRGDVGGGGKDKPGKSPIFNPPAPPAPAPVAPFDPTTGGEAWNNLLSQLTKMADTRGLYQLQQWGLVPTGGTKIPSQYQPLFDREFNNIFGPEVRGNLITPDMTADGNVSADEFQQALTRAQAMIPQTFGNNALNAEQGRLRNTYTAGLDKAGYKSQVQNAFGTGADDDIINSILQQQYDPARAMIENQYKRGLFNPAGYNYALNQLDTQRNEGQNKLNTIGEQQRTAAMGDVNNWLNDIYGQAGRTRLGQSFDPNSYGTELADRIGNATGSLSGRIGDAAPNIFDPEIIQRDAGTVQGVTSRGSLLDTLASRKQRQQTSSRGIGSTGAF